MTGRRSRHSKSPGGGRKRQQPEPSSPIEVTVEKLGSEGFGVARIAGNPILVADALPGERVLVLPATPPKHARLVGRITISPDRVSPPCPHFSVCGGCALQHLARPPYEQFKRDLIAQALRREGMAAIDIAPTLISPPHSRRRATLAIRRLSSGVVLGFHARSSHEIVGIGTCVVLRPELEALFTPLRHLFGGLLRPGQAAQAVLTAVKSGVDLGLVLPETPDLASLESLSGFANELDLARLWWRSADLPPQPLAERRAAAIDLAGIGAFTPMGGFLQATEQGQDALIAAVLAGLGPASNALDLYAGIGTFTLPLAAKRITVHAVEGDAAAVAAIASSARRAALQITAERRDLELRPLRPDELRSYDGLVFDPPRAGARAQVEMIAQSEIPRIVAVSCNPATFARDAGILVKAGWHLKQLQPVDQFLWSPHIELVAHFER